MKIVISPDINHFVIVSLLMEKSPSGMTQTSYTVDVLRTYYTDNFAIFKIVCECLFVVFLSVTTFTILKKLIKEKKAFCRDSFKVFELLFTGCCWAAVGMYICRYIWVRFIMQDFKDGSGKHLNSK